MLRLIGKERYEAKRFGYTTVVWCKRKNGVPFHQAFIKYEDAEDFARGVEEHGGQVEKIEKL